MRGRIYWTNGGRLWNGGQHSQMDWTDRIAELEDDGVSDKKRLIRNLELIDWVEPGRDMRTIALESGVKIDEQYHTFDDLRDSILEHGPMVVPGKLVDLIFLVLDGEYDNQVLAIRHSGRNIRRFLIREDYFQHAFGDFEGCLSHLLSNNAVECEIEIQHLYDMGESLGLQIEDLDMTREYGRLDIDIIAALQLLDAKERLFGDDPDCEFSFKLGYCVGRLFSSAQNFATLEPEARKAGEYESSYRERGKKGKSQARKRQRLDHLFEHLCKLVRANPGFSRMKPVEVARLAITDAAHERPELWSQGRGQLENYLTCFASEKKYRATFRELFPKTG